MISAFCTNAGAYRFIAPIFNTNPPRDCPQIGALGVCRPHQAQQVVDVLLQEKVPQQGPVNDAGPT